MRLESVALLLIFFPVLLAPSSATAGAPRGAKVLFESGEGTAVSTRSGGHTTKGGHSLKQEQYVGLSYKLILLRPKGSFAVLSRSRTYRSTDRVRMIVRCNRQEYITVTNIDAAGDTSTLFDDFVEARKKYEIPEGSSFHFRSGTGTEKILVMLSVNPNPLGRRQKPAADNVTRPATPAPPPARPVLPPPPGSLPPPPPGSPPPPTPPPGNVPQPSPAPAKETVSIPSPAELLSNIELATGLVVQDAMKTSYVVVSPKNGWKPSAKEAKDILVESTKGENYVVVPIYTLDDDAMLVLELKLSHK